MNPAQQQKLRQLPGVDLLLESAAVRQAQEALSRAALVRAIRETLDDARSEIAANDDTLFNAQGQLLLERLEQRIVGRAQKLARPPLRRVINASGVIVHTNIGRAPLNPDTLAYVTEIGRGYSNLEYDLGAGQRSNRQVHLQQLIGDLTGAEAAMVVNNNAAAVLLGLAGLARGREVLVSRGELVEIGGSFRMPDVMQLSGCILREVGTTNKTHLRDYEEALGDNSALLCKIHQSNFRIVGFSSSVSAAELVQLGGERGLPVMEDLGGGCLTELGHGLSERRVQQAVADGVDLVTFSGDKLLGGPQAGLMVGSAAVIERLKRHPLARALRIDKLTLAALTHTLLLHRDAPPESIPVLRMVLRSVDSVQAEAQALRNQLTALCGDEFEFEVVPGESRFGGGALPDCPIPTRLLTLQHATFSAHQLEQMLRQYATPIICRVNDERITLDIRTLQPGDAAEVAKAFAGIAANRAR